MKTNTSNPWLVGLFCLLSTISLAQDLPDNSMRADHHEKVVAQISVITGVTNSVYSFTSNWEIPEWKALRLEERLLIRFPDLLSASIDWNTQEVKLGISNDLADDLLSQIVPLFKYDSYVQN